MPFSTFSSYSFQINVAFGQTLTSCVLLKGYSVNSLHFAFCSPCVYETKNWARINIHETYKYVQNTTFQFNVFFAVTLFKNSSNICVATLE